MKIRNSKSVLVFGYLGRKYFGSFEEHMPVAGGPKLHHPEITAKRDGAPIEFILVDPAEHYKNSKLKLLELEYE